MRKSQASKVFGFSQTSLRKYVKDFEEQGEESFRPKKRGVKRGSGLKIKEEGEKDLIWDILNHMPEEEGLPYTLWNSRVVHKYVTVKYSVNYNRRSIRKIMTRLGFTAQKPIKQAYQRNDSKVTNWLQNTYPIIKMRATREGARIFWGDEMGLQSTDNAGRSYGLIGQKPVIRQSGSRFKCNMLAAISPQGFMNWMVFKENFTSKTFINFLGRLIRQTKQKILLIVDNHNVHHSIKVKNYVEKHKENFELFYLPPYCPELNPQELVNQVVKANANNFRSIKSIDDLITNLCNCLSNIQFDQF